MWWSGNQFLGPLIFGKGFKFDLRLLRLLVLAAVELPVESASSGLTTILGLDEDLVGGKTGLRPAVSEGLLERWVLSDSLAAFPLDKEM